MPKGSNKKSKNVRPPEVKNVGAKIKTIPQAEDKKTNALPISKSRVAANIKKIESVRNPILTKTGATVIKGEKPIIVISKPEEVKKVISNLINDLIDIKFGANKSRPESITAYEKALAKFYPSLANLKLTSEALLLLGHELVSAGNNKIVTKKLPPDAVLLANSLTQELSGIAAYVEKVIKEKEVADRKAKEGPAQQTARDQQENELSVAVIESVMKISGSKKHNVEEKKKEEKELANILEQPLLKSIYKNTLGRIEDLKTSGKPNPDAIAKYIVDNIMKPEAAENKYIPKIFADEIHNSAIAKGLRSAPKEAPDKARIILDYFLRNSVLVDKLAENLTSEHAKSVTPKSLAEFYHYLSQPTTYVLQREILNASATHKKIDESEAKKLADDWETNVLKRITGADLSVFKAAVAAYDKQMADKKQREQLIHEQYHNSNLSELSRLERALAGTLEAASEPMKTATLRSNQNQLDQYPEVLNARAAVKSARDTLEGVLGTPIAELTDATKTDDATVLDRIALLQKTIEPIATNTETLKEKLSTLEATLKSAAEQEAKKEVERKEAQAREVEIEKAKAAQMAKNVEQLNTKLAELKNLETLFSEDKSTAKERITEANDILPRMTTRDPLMKEGIAAATNVVISLANLLTDAEKIPLLTNDDAAKKTIEDIDQQIALLTPIHEQFISAFKILDTAYQQHVDAGVKTSEGQRRIAALNQFDLLSSAINEAKNASIEAKNLAQTIEASPEIAIEISALKAQAKAIDDKLITTPKPPPLPLPDTADALAIIKQNLLIEEMSNLITTLKPLTAALQQQTQSVATDIMKEQDRARKLLDGEKTEAKAVIVAANNLLDATKTAGRQLTEEFATLGRSTAKLNGIVTAETLAFKNPAIALVLSDIKDHTQAARVIKQGIASLQTDMQKLNEKNAQLVKEAEEKARVAEAGRVAANLHEKLDLTEAAFKQAKNKSFDLLNDFYKLKRSPHFDQLSPKDLTGALGSLSSTPPPIKKLDSAKDIQETIAAYEQLTQTITNENIKHEESIKAIADQMAAVASKPTTEVDPALTQALTDARNKLTKQITSAAALITDIDNIEPHDRPTALTSKYNAFCLLYDAAKEQITSSLSPNPSAADISALTTSLQEHTNKINAAIDQLQTERNKLNKTEEKKSEPLQIIRDNLNKIKTRFIAHGFNNDDYTLLKNTISELETISKMAKTSKEPKPEIDNVADFANKLSNDMLNIHDTRLRTTAYESGKKVIPAFAKHTQVIEFSGDPLVAARNTIAGGDKHKKVASNKPQSYLSLSVSDSDFNYWTESIDQSHARINTLEGIDTKSKLATYLEYVDPLSHACHSDTIEIDDALKVEFIFKNALAALAADIPLAEDTKNNFCDALAKFLQTNSKDPKSKDDIKAFLTSPEGNKLLALDTDNQDKIAKTLATFYANRVNQSDYKDALSAISFAAANSLIAICPTNEPISINDAFSPELAKEVAKVLTLRGITYEDETGYRLKTPTKEEVNALNDHVNKIAKGEEPTNPLFKVMNMLPVKLQHPYDRTQLLPQVLAPTFFAHKDLAAVNDKTEGLKSSTPSKHSIR